MNVSAKVEALCDMCYEGGVDKEIFVAMTEYFMLNMISARLGEMDDPPELVIRHLDTITERETMVFLADVEEERKMIAEMKQEYLMEDCPSWRRLEIQQDLSTHNELVPNLPFPDDE